MTYNPVYAPKTAPETIRLLGDGETREAPLADPGAYDNFITPGMLIEMVNGEVRPHSTSAGNAQPMFALEFGLDGRGIDDQYEVDGETVLYMYAQGGNQVYALLAAGVDAPVDGLLQSHGDGYLANYDPSGATPLRPVARALEHVDNDPGTGGAPVRITVEVL